MGIHNAQMHLIWTFQLLSGIFLPACFGWQVKIMMMNGMVTKIIIFWTSKTTVSHSPLHTSLSDLKNEFISIFISPLREAYESNLLWLVFFSDVKQHCKNLKPTTTVHHTPPSILKLSYKVGF